jgi:hypothetical protein
MEILKIEFSHKLTKASLRFVAIAKRVFMTRGRPINHNNPSTTVEGFERSFINVNL